MLPVFLIKFKCFCKILEIILCLKIIFTVYTDVTKDIIPWIALGLGNLSHISYWAINKIEKIYELCISSIYEKKHQIHCKRAIDFFTNEFSYMYSSLCFPFVNLRGAYSVVFELFTCTLIFNLMWSLKPCSSVWIIATLRRIIDTFLFNI